MADLDLDPDLVERAAKAAFNARYPQTNARFATFFDDLSQHSRDVWLRTATAILTEIAPTLKAQGAAEERAAVVAEMEATLDGWDAAAKLQGKPVGRLASGYKHAIAFMKQRDLEEPNP